MPASFTDQNGRIRRTLQVALAEGSVFEKSRSEDGGRMVVIEARRMDGTRVAVRFRGVQKSTMSLEPEAGTALRLLGVGPAGVNLLRLFFPRVGSMAGGLVRVRIDAGSAQLEIVCQDAEWWEEESQP